MPTRFIQNALKLRTLLLISIISLSSTARTQEPIRIAFMDPLSGAFASVGTSGLKQLEFAADYLFNSRGGILDGRTIEIVPLDNQNSPTETQIQFRRACSDAVRHHRSTACPGLGSVLGLGFNQFNYKGG